MGRILIFTIPSFLILSVVLNFILIGVYSYTYNVLTKETLISKVKFLNVDTKKKEHLAVVFDKDDNEIGKYKIYGDQFQLDAKFMKMKYWSNLLGLESRYELERLQGRYSNNKEQNSKKTISHDLSEDTLLDTFSFFGWNFFVDTDYGSSTYKNIQKDYNYNILKTTTGIIVREIPIKKVEEKSYLDSLMDDAKKLVN